MKVFLLLIFLCAVSKDIIVADDIGDIVDELFEGYPEYRGLRDILLDGLIDYDTLKKAYFVRLTQMKVGFLWEKLFVIEGGFDKLPNGLDLVNNERRIVIELKNSWQSDNYNSQKKTFDKLADYKKQNPEFTCVYANINGRTDEGTNHEFYHNGQRLYQITGNELLEFIFGEKYLNIINIVKEKLRFKFQNI